MEQYFSLGRRFSILARTKSCSVLVSDTMVVLRLGWRHPV
jgi:hypothetical protein